MAQNNNFKKPNPGQTDDKNKKSQYQPTPQKPGQSERKDDKKKK